MHMTNPSFQILDLVYIYTVNNLKRQENLHLKMSSAYVVCLTFKTYFRIQANSVDPDQTAPKGAV